MPTPSTWTRPGWTRLTNKHYQAYCRIFERCGLRYSVVEAHSGAMGGSQSQEYMVASEAGEDLVALCPGCGYAAKSGEGAAVPSNPLSPIRKATSNPRSFTRRGGKTIAEVAEFTGLPETSQMKSLVLVADGKPVLVLVRGDHQLSETKLGSIVNDPEFRPARPDEIRQWFGAERVRWAGGCRNMPILADQGAGGPAQHDRGAPTKTITTCAT